MGFIPIPDKNPNDTYTASEFNQMKNDGINDNNARIDDLETSAGNVILSVNDLPAPVGGVITLADDNETYTFVGQIDLGANRIEITGVNVKFRGGNAFADVILSTTTGAVVSGTNVGFSMQNLQIQSFTASELLSFTDAGTNTVTIFTSVFVGGTTDSVFINGVETFAFEYCAFVGGANAIHIDGTITSGVVNFTKFDSIPGTCIDFNSSMLSAVIIGNNTAQLLASSTFLDVLANGGNISANGKGDIINNKVLGDPAGTAITNDNIFSTKWSVFGNTSNIKTSDRINPTGWGAYADAETTPATQSFNTTPAKLQIDGGGAITNEDYLPKSIRGTGSLWDATNDLITPVTLGDSYDVRVNVEVTAKTSNPNILRLELDIGGGGSPTVVIVQDDKSVTAAPPYSLIYTFPIYDLATFFANGAQIFFSTDTGSLTVGARSISIFRTSSGAS